MLAVMPFALPLGIAVERLYRTEAVTSLQQDVARVAAVVPDAIPGGRVTLPPASASPARVAVYDTTGPPHGRAGPSRSALAARGGKTQVRVGVEGLDLAVSPPSHRTRRRPGRSARPYPQPRHRTRAPGLGRDGSVRAGRHRASRRGRRRQAVRLATPLERLTQAARALGDGDFTYERSLSACGKPTPLARPLRTPPPPGAAPDRDRGFSSDVSHQLRTPITALRST